jgi:putative flippase GtrA
MLGAVVQFVGTKQFAFRDRSPDWARQGLQFAGVEMLGFAANAVLFDVLVTHTHTPYLAARCLGSFLVYVAICVPLWTRIFNRPEGA